MYVGAGVSFVGLLYFVGPLCKCDAGLDILYNCVASFVYFSSILGMGACKPRITKTRGIDYVDAKINTLESEGKYSPSFRK